MSCESLNPEDYQLYVLGLAEEPEAELIRAHMAEGCARCLSQLRQSVEFWYLFALIGADESAAMPSAHLRLAIMAQVTDRRPAKWWVLHWTWPQAVATSMAIVMASALSWYAGDQGFVNRSKTEGQRAERERSTAQAPAPGQPSSVVATPPAASLPAAASQAEIDALKERLAKAEADLASRERAVASAGASAEAAALQQALADARTSLRDSQQALSQQETKTAALERDLQTQRTALATAVRERQDADNRARTLAEDRAGAEARAAAEARERQVRSLTARVEQLEQENAEFRRVVNRQRRELEQSFQVASLLNSPALKMVKLQPTEKSETALGYAFVEGSRVLFVASKLPDLPAGRQYQLWLIRGRGTPIVSGGVFSSGQRAVIEIRDPKLTADLKALAVTDEPAGGSPLPTGHKFLVGATRS